MQSLEAKGDAFQEGTDTSSKSEAIKKGNKIIGSSRQQAADTHVGLRCEACIP